MSGVAKTRQSRRPQSPPELEIEHDEALLERSEKVQHAAWGVMLAVVIAAVLGLFGSGPLSATERSAAGMTIEYQRFERCQRSSTLTLTLDPSASGEAAVTLPGEWLDRVRIDAITPQPISESASDDRATWWFATEPGAPTVATFHFVPERAGNASGWVARDGGEPVPFRQFLWP